MSGIFEPVRRFFRLEDDSGSPISTSNRLPVNAEISGDQLAREATLTAIQSELADKADDSTLQSVLSELESKADDATLASILTELQKKADPDEAQLTTLSGRNIADDADVTATFSDEGGLLTRPATHTRVDTIIDAMSIAPGEHSGFHDLNPTNESLLWVLVNTDVAPWRLMSRYPWNDGGSNTQILYPVRDQEADTFPVVNNPAVSLLLGLPVGPDTGLTPPSTLAEAMQLAWPWTIGGPRILVNNQSETETMTVTVRAYRVWR